MAEQGEGLALGWQRSVQARLDSGVLVRVPGFVMPKPGVINAYLPKHTAVNPFASPFVAILKDTLGTTQAG